VGTEEDGVDEAGRTTQPPLIMAPPVPKADPDEVAEDAVNNNGIMAPSRTRTESSRSGAAPRSSQASESNGSKDLNGESPFGASAVTEAIPVAEATAGGEPTTAVPLPADTIGRGKVRFASGEAGDKGKNTEKQGGQQTMTGDKPDAPTAAGLVDGAKSDRKASFRPSENQAAPSAPVTPAARPSTPGSAASYTGPSEWTPSYTRTEWSTGLDSTATTRGTGPQAAASGAPVTSATPSQVGAPSHNGYSSGSGFSSGVGTAAAGAVGGAAAGLANSVSSTWPRRGAAEPKKIQTRKSTKRQAMLTLARVEPWSVMKFSFVASVVAFIILFVAVAVLYMVLAALGVFDSLQHTVSTMTSSQGSAGTNISHWFSASLILGYTAMLGALNIVLITAMSTVGSVIYNLIAKTIGGIEVTLRETD
jgi:Transmembrane domain of unknown function (DUF3566)